MDDSLLAFLSVAAAFPHSESSHSVERHDGPDWYQFLTARHVYQLPRANGKEVPLAARERELERHIRLNDRLAKGVYEAVVPLYCQGGRWSFEPAGADPAAFCLRRRRLPSDCRLDRRIAAGSVSEHDIDALANTLASFFQSAKSGERIGRAASAAAIESSLRQDLKTLRELDTEAPGLGRVEAALLDFAARKHLRFEQRIELKKVRDGHGDLRLENIYLTDSVTIIGCRGGNDRERHHDVIEEISRLLVDLASRSRPDLAEALRSRLAERLDEDPGDPLFSFYQARQAVRLAMAALADEDPSTNRSRARQLLGIARQHAAALAPQRILVMCGPMGTGKTTLAYALAQTLGARRVAAEVVAPAAMAATSARPGCPTQLQAVYDALLCQAAELLEQGFSVVVDARFSSRAQREQARQLARAHGARIGFLECRLSKSETIARLDRQFRRDRTQLARRPERLEEQRSAFEALDEAASDEVVALSTAQGVPELVETVLEWLDRGV